MEIQQPILLAVGVIGLICLLILSGIAGDQMRVDESTEGFDDNAEINKHLRLEAYHKGWQLGKRLADLGYWSSFNDSDHKIFSRMVATPEALYYKISLNKLRASITVEKLTSESLLRELEYTAESRLTTHNDPEHGVWLIAHRPGYEITDASYKPYLDKRKNEAA